MKSLYIIQGVCHEKNHNHGRDCHVSVHLIFLLTIAYLRD